MKKIFKYVKGFIVNDYKRVKHSWAWMHGEEFVEWKFNVIYWAVAPVMFIALILLLPIWFAWVWFISRDMDISYGQMIKGFIKKMCGVE